jgi:hypothetical protein
MNAVLEANPMSARSVGIAVAIWLIVVFASATPPLKAQEAEIKKLQRDVAELKDVIRQREMAIIETKTQIDRLQRELLAAQATAKQLEAQNQDLLALIQKLQREIAAPKAAPKVNPPATDVKGVVLKVDAKDPTLLHLSIGSDSGLSVNHTLEVFRLKPAPRYLATVRVVDVAATSSVGRLVMPAGAKAPEIRPGDQVASQVLPDEPAPKEKR